MAETFKQHKELEAAVEFK